MAHSAEFTGFRQGDEFGQANLNNITITLKRSPCFGTCPYYSLNIFGNGTVLYNGYKFVNITGPRISNISENIVSELVREFHDINYFSLEDNYTKIIATDQSTVTILDSLSD